MSSHSGAGKPVRARSAFDSSGSLHYCGFECPGCGFQYRLSDSSEGKLIIDLFRAPANAHSLSCPECGGVTNYERKDLKFFGGFRD